MTVPEASAVVARLAAGIKQLEPVLSEHGFKLASRDAGNGSGGQLATADFTKGDRTLHLWLRGQSLSVRYDIAGRELTHSDYMRELLGAGGDNKFPSFSEDAPEAFRALRHDLQRFGQGFLSGDGSDYRRCWEAAQQDSQRSGLQRLARIEQQLKGD